MLKKNKMFPFCGCRLFIMISGLLVLAACAPSDPVRLGFVSGLSGRVADLGVEGRNGALLAVEMRNKAGGVRGRRVEMFAEDDQQDPEAARKAVSKLIELKVDAIVGPMTSAMATVTVPLVNEARLLMVSPTVTTNSLTGLDDYFFRVLADTKTYSKKSADYHFHQLGLRRVAAVFDLGNKSYTQSWLEDYRAAFSAIGGELVDSVGFSSSSQILFSDLARQALASKPDGILILANSVDAAMLCQHLRKLDSSIPITASEWAATEQLIELGGLAVDGVVLGQFLDRQSSQKNYVEFRKNYIERFGREPGFAGLTAFDATNVIFEGIEHQASGQALKDSLLARKSFSGAQSPVVFDAFGDASRDTYLTSVKNGSFVLLQ